MKDKGRLMQCMVCGTTYTLIKIMRGEESGYICLPDFKVLQKNNKLQELGIKTRRDVVE